MYTRQNVRKLGEIKRFGKIRIFYWAWFFKFETLLFNFTRFLNMQIINAGRKRKKRDTRMFQLPNQYGSYFGGNHFFFFILIHILHTQTKGPSFYYFIDGRPPSRQEGGFEYSSRCLHGTFPWRKWSIKTIF